MTSETQQGVSLVFNKFTPTCKSTKNQDGLPSCPDKLHWYATIILFVLLFSLQVTSKTLNLQRACKSIIAGLFERVSCAHNLTNITDWSNVGFKVREVNGHMESHYSKATGKWSAPQFVRDPYLRIHGMAPALNYGQQAYEGLKAFRTSENKIQIFRPSKNAKRLQHSSEFISVPPPPESLFLEAVHAAVALNSEFVPPFETGAAMYIRPLIFGSSAQLGLSPPEEYTFCVYVLPTGVYHGVHPVKALILEDFDRSAPNGTGSAKVGGNYAPVLRHSDKARNEGYGITLHLDSQTRSEIDEFSTSGFIGVNKDGDNITVAVPDSRCVIDSVTSDSVLQIAKSAGYNVEKRSIKYEELPSFSEVIAAGTAAALVPIRSITRRSRDDVFEYINENSEEPGPVFSELLKKLQNIQRGIEKDPYGWCEVVAEPEQGKYGDGERTKDVLGDRDVDELP